MSIRHCGGNRGDRALAARAALLSRNWGNGALIALLLFCGLAGGCGPAIRPGKLPVAYQVSPTPSPTRLDLSGLARPVPSSETIHPGDSLRVSVVTGLEDEHDLPWPALRVNEEGVVVLPLIGPVPVAGLELTSAERRIAEESVRRGIYVTPQVTVSIDNRRSHRVTVMGAVSEPGVKDLPAPNSDLMTALVAAGGLTDEAGTLVEIQQPELVPGGPMMPGVTPAGYTQSQPHVAFRRRVVDLLRANQPNNNVPLPDGSVVRVIQQPVRTVSVIGLVNKPDEIEIPAGEDLRLLGAIAKAGGQTLQVANKVRIQRHVSDRTEPIVIETTIRAAKRGPDNILLAGGDIVSVEETPTTFTVEMLRSFIRFGFTSTVPGL